METMHASGMHVRIHDQYAELLGYTHLKGALGIIDDVMSAMCGVIILDGPPGHSFIRQDIHIEDCELITLEQGQPFGALININTGHIYHTHDRKLLDFAAGCMHQSSIRMVHNFRGVDEIHDFCDTTLSSVYDRLKNRMPDFDWQLHRLDDITDAEAYRFNKVYLGKRASEQAQAKSQQVVHNMAQILEALRTQSMLPAIQKDYPFFSADTDN